MKKNKKENVQVVILLDITFVDGSCDVRVAPDNWLHVTDGIRLGWLNEKYPFWLTAIEEEHGLHRPLRFDRFPLINTDTYEIRKELMDFQPVKREALKIQEDLLREHPEKLGLAAPTPEMLNKITQHPDVTKLIREKAKEAVKERFEGMETQLRKAHHQRGELAELRKQAVMEGFPCIIKKLMRELVYEQSPSGLREEVSAFKDTAFTLYPLVCALNKIKKLVVDYGPPDLVSEVEAHLNLK